MVWKDHSDAGYIAEDDLVMGIVINGEARSYPRSKVWSMPGAGIWIWPVHWARTQLLSLFYLSTNDIPNT